MPLTLIAGIGGMSEWSMMTGPENWKISYPLFLLGMVVLALITYLLLKDLKKGKRTGRLNDMTIRILLLFQDQTLKNVFLRNDRIA